MTKNSFNKEMLELQIGEVVGAMNASASPVQAMFYLEEDQKRLALMNPQHLCKLSLVLMSNVAWGNLGIDVKDHACVGLFFECDNVLHCAVVDGELVRIVKPCFPFRSELERVEAGTFIHSNPSWANIRSSQSLVLTIILNCLVKYALENLVQRLFLPWGSVPFGSDPKI